MQCLRRLLPLGCVLLTGVGLLLAGCGREQAPVVVYSAHERVFALDLMDQFRMQRDWWVDAHFAQETGSSLDLYEQILKEKQQPVCDVFWNNEVLHTVRLQQQGLLEPYPAPASDPYPEFTRASDHTWHGFAARALVLIVNTDRVDREDWPRKLRDLSDPRFRGAVVMARPDRGASATHSACLFAQMGSGKARTFFRGLHTNGVVFAPTGSEVAEWVAKGQTNQAVPVAVGLTDSEHAIAQVKMGHPVAIIYPDSQPDQQGTLFIPSTVAILKHSPNPEGARHMVDYLLSLQVETRLAESPGHLIPLNPRVKVRLPDPLKRPNEVHVMEVDFQDAAQRWQETQAFLEEEFQSELKEMKSQAMR